MLQFHVVVQGPHAAAGLPVTFDAALEALERLPRMFIEPDGSFVWRGTAADGTIWQVDGNLIDQGPCLAYVELRGICADEQFDALLTALGWPAAELVFQLPSEGLFLSEAEFRRRSAAMNKPQ
jgi:hypothetical protein